MVGPKLSLKRCRWLLGLGQKPYDAPGIRWPIAEAALGPDTRPASKAQKNAPNFLFAQAGARTSRRRSRSWSGSLLC